MSRMSLFVLIGFLAANLSADRPPWLKAGRHAGYPSSLYIQAIGQAERTGKAEEDWQRAKQAAFQQIAQEIQVKIAGKRRVIKLEFGEKQFYREQSEEETVSETNIKLSGLWIQDTYYDKKQKIYYALAILDRRKAAQALKNEQALLLARGRSAYNEALRLFSKAQLRQALSTLRRCYQDISAATERQVLIGVLTGSAMKPEQVLDTEKILQVLQQNVSRLQLESQTKSVTLPSDLSLPYDIQVRATFHDAPVPMLRLQAQFHRGSGSVDIAEPTDTTGTASIRIARWGPAPGGLYRLEIRPDLHQYLLSDAIEGAASWNEILTRAGRSISINVRRLDLNLDDYIYEEAFEKIPNFPLLSFFVKF